MLGSTGAPFGVGVGVVVVGSVIGVGGLDGTTAGVGGDGKTGTAGDSVADGIVGRADGASGEGEVVAGGD